MSETGYDWHEVQHESAVGNAGLKRDLRSIRHNTQQFSAAGTRDLFSIERRTLRAALEFYQM